MTRRTSGSRRTAFTLIELLIVITIIVLLMGLLLPALNGARIAARRATTAAEIAQLGSAVGQFKAQTKMTYLPAFRPGNSGLPFRLCSNYRDNTTGAFVTDPGGAVWPEVTYLKQLFPQMENQQVGGIFDNGLRDPNIGFVPNTNPILLDPNQLLLFFLTGSTFTSFQGFSTNKVTPLAAPATGGQSIGPFLNVNGSKLDTASPPHFVDSMGAQVPYAYLSFDPNLNGYSPGVCFGTVSPYLDQKTGKPLNANSFQIISAGYDDTFGPGGKWTPAAGAWDPYTGPNGADDLSNFNNGVLAVQSSN